MSDLQEQARTIRRRCGEVLDAPPPLSQVLSPLRLFGQHRQPDAGSPL
ncbi:MAG: hypothetical protein ACRDTC_13015 [Pseudonocardiaceae bacterium]